jgi:hypothetical protein
VVAKRPIIDAMDIIFRRSNLDCRFLTKSAL